MAHVQARRKEPSTFEIGYPALHRACSRLDANRFRRIMALLSWGDDGAVERARLENE